MSALIDVGSTVAAMLAGALIGDALVKMWDRWQAHRSGGRHA